MEATSILHNRILTCPRRSKLIDARLFAWGMNQEDQWLEGKRLRWLSRGGGGGGGSWEGIGPSFGLAAEAMKAQVAVLLPVLAVPQHHLATVQGALLMREGGEEKALLFFPPWEEEAACGIHLFPPFRGSRCRSRLASGFARQDVGYKQNAGTISDAQLRRGRPQYRLPL